MNPTNNHRIHLLRHGELEGKPAYCGTTDRKLSAKGWQQMWQACDVQCHWQLIVSSPLSRCLDFARKLAAVLGIPLEVDERWQEMDFGQWEGKTAEEILSTPDSGLLDFWQDPINTAPPGGESLPAVQARVLRAWHELLDRQRNALVVTHAGPIRIVRCQQEQHPLRKLMELEVKHASLYSITINAT